MVTLQADWCVILRCRKTGDEMGTQCGKIGKKVGLEKRGDREVLLGLMR